MYKFIKYGNYNNLNLPRKGMEPLDKIFVFLYIFRFFKVKFELFS